MRRSVPEKDEVLENMEVETKVELLGNNALLSKKELPA
jgi:hypothetical protein